MKNIVLTGLLFLCLHPVQSLGQTIPPPPPPSPVYDPSDTKKAEEARMKAEMEAAKARIKAMKEAEERAKSEKKSSDGLRFTRITVWGNYQLGMLRQEYDSIAKLETFSIKTDSFSNTLQGQPSFIGKRLSSLVVVPGNGLFNSDLSDITAFFEDKYDAPDIRIIRDTSETFPSARETSLSGDYRVKESHLQWIFRYYDIAIESRLIDIKNGTWKGNYIIKIEGNKEFIKLLKELELKEK